MDREILGRKRTPKRLREAVKEKHLNGSGAEKSDTADLRRKNAVHDIDHAGQIRCTETDGQRE